jgi:hypothetical protein
VVSVKVGRNLVKAKRVPVLWRQQPVRQFVNQNVALSLPVETAGDENLSGQRIRA